jgi:hypothetical protein
MEQYEKDSTISISDDEWNISKDYTDVFEKLNLIPKKDEEQELKDKGNLDDFNIIDYN